MQPTSLHGPLSHVTLVLRGARHALHPLWIPTRTLRGPSLLETWQLQLVVQNCVRYHLCVVQTFYYRMMIRTTARAEPIRLAPT